jgi:hypothetical protein
LHLSRRPFSRCWLPSGRLDHSCSVGGWSCGHLPQCVGGRAGSGILTGVPWVVLVSGSCCHVAFGCSRLGRAGWCAFGLRGRWRFGAGCLASRGSAFVVCGLGRGGINAASWRRGGLCRFAARVTVPGRAGRGCGARGWRFNSCWLRSRCGRCRACCCAQRGHSRGSKLSRCGRCSTRGSHSSRGVWRSDTRTVSARFGCARAGFNLGARVCVKCFSSGLDCR